jgi:serine protease Do
MSRKRVALLVTAALGAGSLWLVPPGSSVSEAAPPAAVTPKMQAPPEARALSKAFSGVARALRPSVVRLDIESEGPRVVSNRGQRRNEPGGRGEPDMREFFERFFDFDGGGPMPGPGQGTGSGLLLDAEGNIVTNSHVVERASKVTVIFSDGRELPARVVGKDTLTDVAVVRLEKPPTGLVAARLGDSDKAEIGEWVLAVGSPLAMDQTVTAGIISSRGRLGRGPGASLGKFGGKVREYIQTDAKINPGNSGGPLVNLEGEVIGINTLINTGPGGAYGFAIPINQVRNVAESLIKNGRMRYTYLGIHMDELRGADSSFKETLPTSAPKEAVLIARVNPNSPASKAGLRPGDVITRIDDRTVAEPRDVQDYVASKPIGARVNLALYRNGKPTAMQVTLEELPDESGDGSSTPDNEGVGIGLQDVTPEIGRFLSVPEGTRGALITEVVPGSRAARAGLQPEDVILEVNRKAVSSADEAAAALKANPGGDQILRIRRGGSTRFVTVPAR